MASIEFPIWTLLPFPALVLAIAIMPIAIPHYGESAPLRIVIALLPAHLLVTAAPWWLER